MSATDLVSAMKKMPIPIVVGTVNVIPLHFWGTRSAISVWSAMTIPPTINDAAS